MRERKAERATDTMGDWWTAIVFDVWQQIPVGVGRVWKRLPESGTPDPLRPAHQFRPWKQ